jgi:hypothetical protein
MVVHDSFLKSGTGQTSCDTGGLSDEAPVRRRGVSGKHGRDARGALGWRMIVVGLALVGSALQAPGDDSAAELCRTQPQRVQALFAALDLERTGLEAVRAAVEKQAWPTACEALLAYYRNGTTFSELRVPPVEPGTGRDRDADAILDDRFVFQTLTGRQPRIGDRRLDWHHTGPSDDKEWAFFLNRHPWFATLLNAWRQTGNPEYARSFDAFLQDWILSNPAPARRTPSAAWRPLEVGLRMTVWPRIFYGFQRADEFTAASRILMLSSVAEQAEYVRRYPDGGNKRLMNMRGLAMAASYWPEFKRAADWLDVALARITPEIGRQVMSDGVHYEMSFSYHWVGVHNLEPIIDLARRADKPLPPTYAQGVERMLDYAAYALRPDGRNPLNSDSDLQNYRGQIKAAARRYNRPDWLYTVTHGLEGARPQGPPSRVWPISGQMVMRSDWTHDAHWAYFDAGPHGGWHGHFDKLHLSVAAYGRDLLVDSGRYWYKGDVWREYFVGSSAHNVILVDGAGQQAAGGSRLERSSSVQPAFDYVRAVYANGFGRHARDVTHTRAVVYLRGLGWVVADRIASPQPRHLQCLWHYHPACTVERDGLNVASVDENVGNLRIVPVGGPDWTLDLIKGRSEPPLQGWYSPEYNVKSPNTVAVYSGRTKNNATFAWLLLPTRGRSSPATNVVPLPAADGALRLRIERKNLDPVEVAVRLAGRRPIALADGVTLHGEGAVMGLTPQPLVVGGRITDAHGAVLATHAY